VRDAVQLAQAARDRAPDGLGVVADRGGCATDSGALGVIVQERPEDTWPGDAFVPAAALVQRGPDGALVLAALPGAARREAFFSAWAGRLLDALVPLLEQGLSPSTDPRHWRGQWRGERLVGVVVEGWWDAAGDPDPHTQCARAFDPWVAGHLGHLVRLLGLGPRGHAVVREHLERLTLPGTAVHEAWTGWTVPHRCRVRSQLEGRPVYRDLPNPLAP
jgi:hypothetical protein